MFLIVEYRWKRYIIHVFQSVIQSAIVHHRCDYFFPIFVVMNVISILDMNAPYQETHMNSLRM